jgi:hypothetical protein
MRITQNEMSNMIGGGELKVVDPANLMRQQNQQAQQAKTQPGVIRRVLQDIPQDIAQVGTGIAGHVQRGADVVTEAAERDAGVLTRARGVLGGFGQAVARSAGEAFMGLVRLPFTQEFEERTAERVGETVGRIVQREFAESVPGVGGKTVQEIAG